MERLSIISIAPGTIPPDTISDTTSPAFTVEPKNATSVRTDSGFGTTRSQMPVAIPSVPSEPTKAPIRSVRDGRARPERELAAVGQHQLEPGYVVGGEAVLEAVRPAGVLGHVAADRADDLAGRVGRVEVGRADRLRHGDVGHAGLHEHAAVVEVDVAMLRMRVRAISTPSATGRAPPESPSAPRATQGAAVSWQARTTPATS